MKKIILIVLVVLIFSGVSYAQIELTERELLIQLNEKVSYINEGIIRIEKNLVTTIDKVYTLENRVTVTEQGINSILEKIKDLSSNWNWLLGVFSTFVIGIFIYIFGKGAYVNRKENHKTN